MVLYSSGVDDYSWGEFERLDTADRWPELMLLDSLGNVSDWFQTCCVVLHHVSSVYIFQ